MTVDNRLQDMPMVPVACRVCGARVLARKSSWHQTSVQWNADAAARCPERAEARRLEAPGGHNVFLACSALSESIVDAVRHGDLRVVDEAVGLPRSGVLKSRPRLRGP
ncbi:ferredoxin [Mycobacterium helveticum]|jgi:hypothetical protein|uniref:Ferredoxin n=1 Tax=Mycobacterium helveticum TaxID=2592811 RepID=A0A557XX45_9MYCO|nr:ferredoxin [Mycobacterium helveticum]TVS86512.1 ferredoxin [Mycobacterium helveticum]TVS90657.1 ferredoxin [Mycobacterium helveticum]